MVEIYWLQRIGALSVLFNVMWIFATIVVGAFLLVAPMAIEVIKENNITNQAKKVAKTLAAILIVGVIGSIITPSTKEMYAIYGLGGTIDYIKSNDKAKQLPDKCVDALTRYVDSIEKENKENKDNND